jgi:hypothetical protein
MTTDKCWPTIETIPQTKTLKWQLQSHNTVTEWIQFLYHDSLPQEIYKRPNFKTNQFRSDQYYCFLAILRYTARAAHDTYRLKLLLEFKQLNLILTAMAIAMWLSVTVSIGDDIIGVLRVMFLVRADSKS